MTKSEIQTKIKIIKDELENRHKYGTIKLANKDGTQISIDELQNELFKLIYRFSKMD